MRSENDPEVRNTGQEVLNDLYSGTKSDNEVHSESNKDDEVPKKGLNAQLEVRYLGEVGEHRSVSETKEVMKC